MIWRLKNSLSWTALLGQQQTRLKNIIGAFQSIRNNTLGYYIVLCTGNAYTLQEQYTCHAFDPTIIIPKGKLVYPAKFMTTMKKSSYCYHYPDRAIPSMVKWKQVVMPYIEFIQDKNTTNKLPSHFKGYKDMNPHLLSEHEHQIILDNIEVKQHNNHKEYVEDENEYNVDSDDSDDDDN